MTNFINIMEKYAIKSDKLICTNALTNFRSSSDAFKESKSNFVSILLVQFVIHIFLQGCHAWRRFIAEMLYQISMKDVVRDVLSQTSYFHFFINIQQSFAFHFIPMLQSDFLIFPWFSEKIFGENFLLFSNFF